MTPKFKFLRRVRIHGGECGAVARALHHRVKDLSLCQADPGKALESTFNERKQMSTKITLKRIVLVAVSALGFGLLSPISAFAASQEATAVTVNAQAPFRAGVTSSIAMTLSAPTSTYSGANTNDLGAKILTAPTGSSLSALTFASRPTSGNRSYAVDSTAVIGTIYSQTASRYDTETAIGTWADGSSTSTGRFLLSFNPHVAGTYTILVWANSHTYSSGLPSTVVTVTTAGAPTTAVLSSVATTYGISAAATNGKGTEVKITLTDAAGLATIPNANESIDVSVSGAADITTVGIAGDAQSTGEKESYGSSTWAYGAIWVPVDNTAAETITLSAEVSGASSGVLGSIALTSKTMDVASVGDSAVAIPSALSTLGTANTGGYTAASGTSTSTNLTTQTLQVTITDPDADVYVGFLLTDTDGLVTGNVGGEVQFVASAEDGDTKAYVSVAASLGTSTSTTYDLNPIAAGTNTVSSGTALTVTGGLSAAHTVSNGTPSVIRLAPAGAPSIRARVTDQFGGGVAYAAVSVSIAGRNVATTITSNYVTDASGYVTFTYTDASTSTTSLTDTVTFTCSACSSDTTGTATVTFSAVSVDTVTVTGAASEDVAPAATYSNIGAGKTGPDGASVAITATVEDANGNLLAGVPVTFTLSGISEALIRKTASVDYTTVYTSTNGTAVTYVIGWKTGATTITATAGGKTGTGKINWLSGTSTANAQAAARVLSGSISKNIASFKVVDRFGNPVANAVINLTRTGNGLFGNGTSSQDVTTDANGTADAKFDGSGTIKAKLSSSYGQAYAAADKVDGTVAAPVAFTAPTAGTTVGTGSTLAPAGVYMVELIATAGSDSATQAAEAATDAAAEAIDAANAATDAANLAAEAADAATVAAEEARDAADAATAAVEELATQVATLMAALKAQITTLANTVAKIAKKVKA